MTRILLIAHEPMASALRAVAGHTFPEALGELEAVDVPAGAGPADVRALLLQALARSPGDTLVLADAFGATPCNVASAACGGERVRIVSGVNVPMLWRALGYRHEPLEQLTERALVGGVQGVMRVSTTPPANQASAPATASVPASDTSAAADHDPVEHRHQQ